MSDDRVDEHVGRSENGSVRPKYPYLRRPQDKPTLAIPLDGRVIVAATQRAPMKSSGLVDG